MATMYLTLSTGGEEVTIGDVEAFVEQARANDADSDTIVTIRIGALGVEL